jgi:RNA polymerase sigma factor (sigma-70 family)
MAGNDAASDTPGLPSGPGGRFPDTSWTLVVRCQAEDATLRRAAEGELVQRYWKPVYRFFQRVLGVKGAELEDTTQELFTRLIEREWLDEVRERTSFRGFLKTACRRFLINRQQSRWARDGRAERLPEGEGLDPAWHDEALASAIDDEFRASYLDEAMERTRAVLEARGKGVYFAVLEARVRRDPPATYAAIASDLGLGLFDVRNYLHSARGTFKDELLALARRRSDTPQDELRELGRGDLLAESA